MDSYKVTFETWDKVAEAYQEKFMNLNLYDDTYDIFCDLIQKPNARIFEIGCGPGNITRYLLAKRPDFKIEAIDIAPSMLELAKANNPTADFKIMDCREVDKITGKFDGIMCGFSMPYLSQEDCEKLIYDSSVLLNQNGIFYFSIIEGNYQNSGFETGSSGNKMYVYYHEETYLKQYLQGNNFELLNLIRKELPKPDGTPSTHLIFIARKKG